MRVEGHKRTVSRRTQGILVIITSSIEGSCQFLINLEMDLASSLPPQMFSVISLLSVSLAISLSVCPCSSVCTIFSFCVMASSSRSLPSHLALNEEEALIHNFDGNGPSSESSCLVVKIISLKNIKPDWLDKAMREAWTLRYPISFTEYHSGLFLAHFGCDGDRRRVIENQPWHFDNCLMVFANPEGLDLLQPEQLKFVPFWMQIHYIPFGFRSPSLAKMVADDIEDLIEIHKNTLLEISGPFLRIRVLLDISKPIRRGMQEMNLRSLVENHDLQDSVNQFLPQASLPCSQVSPTTLVPTDHQVHSSSPMSSQDVVTSDSQFSGLQSLLCAPSTIVHTDKGKGIQASDSFVPPFPPRALSIGGGSGTKRSFVKRWLLVLLFVASNYNHQDYSDRKSCMIVLPCHHKDVQKMAYVHKDVVDETRTKPSTF
ncbi:hypothetical protein G4B88_018229 [Cannabis sativa]|uniref:DUF4283 domain-containing protein n=1 Tax=Cannabis sativa TaxID=3483 RepID=A0A7J6F815_CANSA|nr:hypothetical protein G4B88_018229 [Cannabis sativa]